MKRFSLKTTTWYALLALVIVVGLLPIIKSIAPEYFPSLDGFRDIDCLGVDCPEGYFCMNNQCRKISTRYPNAVPTGNE